MDYSSSQMSYDLRRLRLHGLIERSPGTNYYTLTSEGIRVAVFYTKLYDRLLRPLLEADRPPAPVELRRASGLLTTSSATTSWERVSGQLPETCHKIQRLGDQEDLGAGAARRPSVSCGGDEPIQLWMTTLATSPSTSWS